MKKRESFQSENDTQEKEESLQNENDTLTSSLMITKCNESLSLRQLLYLTVDDIVNVISNISPHHTSLDLDNNFLNSFIKPNELKRIALAIPKTAKFLGLSGNSLGLTGYRRCSSIPKYTDRPSIPQRGGRLVKQDVNVLIDFVSNLPKTLLTLDLSYNKLNLLTNEELKNVLQAVPKNIRLIRLQYNNLFQKKRSKRDYSKHINLFLTEIGDMKLSERLELSFNGEPDIHHYIEPIIQMHTAGVLLRQISIPSDITLVIASFLVEKSIKIIPGLIIKWAKSIDLRKQCHKDLCTEIKSLVKKTPLENNNHQLMFFENRQHDASRVNGSKVTPRL